MRKVIAATFVSLDGVMQAPGGPEEDPTGGFRFGGWTFPYFDHVLGEEMGRIFVNPFDLLLGRKTYEIFAAHWPYSNEEPIASAFNAATKYVATRSLQNFDWQNSVALRDAATDVRRLKHEDGRDLMIQGSSGLLQTLLENDLIDEFNLLVFPVILGKGKRLFGPTAMPAGLALVESKTSTTGVVVMTYGRGGDIKTGSFQHAEPTKAELARREKMKREG